MPKPKLQSVAIVTTGIVSIGAIYLGMAWTAMAWGLPSRNADAFLFGRSNPWSGSKTHELAGSAEKFAPERGADVDLDPVPPDASGEPVLSTRSDADVAKLLLRYRLYTFQPDEMITLMALAGMRPGEWQFDPRLYQYGGLFIYPVGALIRLCGLAGWIEVRNDLTYYLDHPDEFARFYVVARAYVAGWGLLGVFVVFAIGRRLGGDTAGLTAALLFSIMPVVVCMSHEAKPHLPGAVLMLAAVWFAQRFLAGKRFGPVELQIETPKVRATNADTIFGRDYSPGYKWLVWILCGAATGMVLSSAPVFVLIPLLAWLNEEPIRNWLRARRRNIPGATHAGDSVPTHGGAVRRLLMATAKGGFISLLVYTATNPYILINLFANREVLRSNFGNSLAMYEVSRVGEGLIRVLQLTAEGASWPVLILGGFGFLGWLMRRASLKLRDGKPHEFGGNAAEILVLVVPAAVFFIQFVLIGAGKPGEYGRFGIFPNAALAIGAGCVLAAAIRRRAILGLALTVFAVAGTAWFGWGYLSNFRADAMGNGSRIALARLIQEESRLAAEEGTSLEIAVLRDPAPYCFPPIHFAETQVVLYPSLEQFRTVTRPGRAILLEPVDVPMPPDPPELSSRYESAFPSSPVTPISWANKPFQVILDPGR